MVRGAGRLRVFVSFLFTLIPFILVLFPYVDMWRDVPLGKYLPFYNHLKETCQKSWIRHYHSFTHSMRNFYACRISTCVLITSFHFQATPHSLEDFCHLFNKVFKADISRLGLSVKSKACAIMTARVMSIRINQYTFVLFIFHIVFLKVKCSW